MFLLLVNLFTEYVWTKGKNGNKHLSSLIIGRRIPVNEMINCLIRSRFLGCRATGAEEKDCNVKSIKMTFLLLLQSLTAYKGVTVTVISTKREFNELL